MQTKLEVVFYLYLSEQIDKNIICALCSLIARLFENTMNTPATKNSIYRIDTRIDTFI